MKKMLIMAVAFMTVSLSSQAQRIEVVDTEGNGIPLVSVLTEAGTLIGTTDLNGVLSDVKGARKVAVTHVAYKPQLVTVASLTAGRVTMEDIDYGLEEIVVKPKPYIYVENYYRFYAFINDSLRYYQAGIIPNAYDVQKKKIYSGSQNNCCGYFCPSFGASITWGARAMEFKAGELRTTSASSMEPGGSLSKKFFTTLTDIGNGRRRIDNPEGTIGYIIEDDGLSRLTIDGSKAQMYRNKTLGEKALLKRREEVNYQYQYTYVYKTDEKGNTNAEDFVMHAHHWEWTKSKGRYKMIIETYATDRDYIDKKEWSAKKKELKREYKDDMTLEQLEDYAKDHHVATLAPTLRRAVKAIE